MRIETSLNVPWSCVKPVIYDIDEWIIDVKDIDQTIYEEYTGVSNTALIDNLLELRGLVDPSRFHIRVPRIPAMNNEKNIEESVKWVKDALGVEPEVFDYYVQ